MKQIISKLNGGATFLSRVTRFSTAPKGDATFLWHAEAEQRRLSRVTKCLTTAAISLAALLITGSAWAVNPVAVWNGDFNINEKAGISIAANSNQIAGDGSSITIADPSKGVQFDLSQVSDFGQRISVIVKYADLNQSGISGNKSLISVGEVGTGKTTYDDVGVRTTGSTVFTGYYSNTGNYGPQTYSAPESGYILFNYSVEYNHNIGVRCYIGEKNDDGSYTWSARIGTDGLRFTAPEYRFTKLAIGGPNASNNGPISGMKIEAVAIFNSDLDTAAAAAYKFPAPPEIQAFYSKWKDAPAILTWKGTTATFHSGDFELFDKESCEPTTTVYDGDGSSVTIIPGQTSVINPSWRVWSYQNNYYGVAPGYVLRFEKDKGYVGTNIDASFAPFDVGGILVEKGATGFGLNGNGRKFALGDPAGVAETWTVINEDFTIDRDASTSQNDREHVALRGIVNIDIASGKTLTFNAAAAKQGITTTGGTVLKMHGEGKMTTKVLVATGAVTLDYSDLSLERTEPFINGKLKVDSNTIFKFPAKLAENTQYQLCADTLTANFSGFNLITVGEKTDYATLSVSGNTVSYAWPAATSEVTIDSDMSWDAVTQLQGYNATVPTTATLTKNVTITFGATATVLPLTFTGPYTATLVYEKTPSIQEIKLEYNAAFKIVIPANSDYAAQSLPAGATSVEFITATGANFNFGANNFIYNYTGSAEISPTITGTGTFTKSGSGTLCVNFGQSRTAETIIDGGVLKTTAQRALGANATITINKDGILDYNGYSNNGQPTIVLNGGTLRNTRESQPTSQMQILNLRLTGSSTIDAQMDFGLVGSSHCQTALNLGEYTLTKDGDGQFHIVNTVVSGSGTIKVAAGSLHVSNFACTMADGTVELDGGNLGLDAAFTLNTLLVKNGAVTGNGALTPTNFKVAGTADMTARALPLTGTLTTDSTGTLKIAKPAKPTKIIAGSAIPAGLTIVDADGNAITDVCVYDGFIWYGTIGTGTYTVTTADENALKAMADGDIYSSATLDVTLSAISGTPEGFFGWVEDHTAYFAKKSNSISIKFTPASANEGTIAATDAKVGGYPVAGKFWNHSKIYTGTGAGTTEIFALKDGNSEALVDGDGNKTLCYYYMPNMYDVNKRNVNGRNKQTTGNGKLTYSYFDDSNRTTPTAWPYSVGTFEGTGCALPQTPTKEGVNANLRWEVAITNIPYQVFDLYIYQASDQTTESIKLLPIAVKANNGVWKYFAGDGKGSTDVANYDTVWDGASYCDAATMVEGTNYIRYRISKAALDLGEDEKIEVVYLSHPQTHEGARLGLAGVQLVEVENDGYYTRNAETTSSAWTAEDSWLNSSGKAITWVNPTGKDVAYATIDTDALADAKITIDSDITTTLVTLKNAAPADGAVEKVFTIDGSGKLTAPIDATEFHGKIVLTAPMSGTLTLGENARYEVNIPQGEIKSIAELLPTGMSVVGNLTITGSGTIVCDGQLPTAYQSSFQADTWAGTVWLKNITTTPGNGWYFPNYGSKIKVTNVKGWFNYSTPFQSVDVELADEDDKTALEFTDGSANRVYGFTSISGNGTLKTSSVHADAFVVKVEDVSNFNGKFISASAGDGTIAIPIYVGTGTPAYGTTSKITFADGVTVKAGLGWEAESVAFGNTIKIVDASAGQTLVSGVTAAPASGYPKVLDANGTALPYCLTFENNAIKLVNAGAKIGTVFYLTLNDAINAAQNNDEIFVLSTIANATVEIQEGKNVVIGNNNGQAAFSGTFTKTGAGTLTTKCWYGTDKNVVDAGTLVVSDEDGLSNYGRPTTVNAGAIFEFNMTKVVSNLNEAFQAFAPFSGTGVVRKAGDGAILLIGSDDQFTECTFNGFSGLIDVTAGALMSYETTLTINNTIVIAEGATVMTAGLTTGAGARIKVEGATALQTYGSLNKAGALYLDLTAFETIENGLRLVSWGNVKPDDVTVEWPVAGAAELTVSDYDEAEWLAVSVAEKKDVVEIEPEKKVVVDDSFVQTLPGSGTVAEKLMAKPSETAPFSYLDGYVLGLGVEQIKSATKPFLKVVTEGDAATNPNKITFNFYVGNVGNAVTPRTGVGKTVTFAVETATSPNAGAGDWTPGEATTENAVEVDLPSDPADTKVRYYRPVISVK